MATESTLPSSTFTITDQQANTPEGGTHRLTRETSRSRRAWCPHISFFSPQPPASIVSSLALCTCRKDYRQFQTHVESWLSHCCLGLEKFVYLCLLWSLAAPAPRPTRLNPATPAVLAVPALPWVRRPALHHQAHLLAQDLPAGQKDREGREDPALHCFLSGRRVPLAGREEGELVVKVIGAGILSCASPSGQTTTDNKVKRPKTDTQEPWVAQTQHTHQCSCESSGSWRS